MSNQNSSWPYDTGEFIALHVPEEAARSRLQGRVNELKVILEATAMHVHNKYHRRDDRNRIKPWEDCDNRICKQARQTLIKEEEM